MKFKMSEYECTRRYNRTPAWGMHGVSWYNYTHRNKYKLLMLQLKYKYTDHGKYWGLPLKY